MITLDTSISVSLIFSVVSMIGVIVSMYATFHSRKDKKDEKNIDIQKQFLTLNLKLDEFGRNLVTLTRTTEKNTDIINEIRNELVRHEEQFDDMDNTIKDHEQRLRELESRAN